MTQKKNVAIGAGAVGILVLAAIGFYISQPREHIVASPDGALILRVLPDMLPDGMKASDIRVSDPERSGDSAVYRLEPDGTVFRKPVPFTLKATTSSDAVPIVVTINPTTGAFDPIDHLIVRIDSGTGTEISGTLKHFSDLAYFFEGGFRAILTAPPSMYVGDPPKKVTLELSRDPSYSSETDYNDDIRLRFSHADKEWTVEGKFSTNGNIQPQLISPAPPKTSVGPAGMKIVKEFSCTKEGFDNVRFEGEVMYRLKKESVPKSMTGSVLTTFISDEVKETSIFILASQRVECVDLEAYSKNFKRARVPTAPAPAAPVPAVPTEPIDVKVPTPKAAQSSIKKVDADSAIADGNTYYVVRSTDPTGDTGNEVCAKHGKTCLGYTVFSTSLCQAFHPGAQVSSDWDGSKAGFYCNGPPQGGVCAKERDTCHICPQCNVNMDCAMEIGVLYRETYVQCK